MAVRMKNIEGWGSKFAITDDGRVWSHVSHKFLKPTRGRSNGYLLQALSDGSKGKSYSLSRLVAQAFIPNPDNLPEVRHKDGNKENNCVSNLEWCSKHDSRMYNNHDKQTAIYCVELDRVFTGFNKASKSTGICVSSLHLCCNGKYKTAGGYHWQYVKENER